MAANSLLLVFWGLVVCGLDKLVGEESRIGQDFT